MARRITWNGTTDEALALLHALRTHCECQVEEGRTLAPLGGRVRSHRDSRDRVRRRLNELAPNANRFAIARYLNQALAVT